MTLLKDLIPEGVYLEDLLGDAALYLSSTVCPVLDIILSECYDSSLLFRSPIRTTNMDQVEFALGGAVSNHHGS